MKVLSQRKALKRLNAIISNFKSEISDNYEGRTKSCLSCETKGACCVDAHFVNVHISRLEAVAINRAIEQLSLTEQDCVTRRIDDAVIRYGLNSDGDSYSQTFACPLFEKGIGCLVHETGKPIPCIAHACYESAADLPPDALAERAERGIDALNTQTYGRHQSALPLPLALQNISTRPSVAADPRESSSAQEI
ncbi:MAG: hypothetical protein WKF34_13445 [Pyrinomonadaceae bacterium]